MEETSKIKNPECRKAVESLLELEKRDDWKLKKDKGGLKGYTLKPDDSPFHMTRGEIVIHQPAKTVVDWMFVNTDNHFKETVQIQDPTVSDCELLEVAATPEDGMLVWAQFETPPLIKSRDFVWREYDIDLGNGIWVITVVNQVSDQKPPMGRNIRGEIGVSGYITRALDDTSCSLTYFTQVDPKGWVPVWVTNLVAMQQIDNLTRIKAHTEGFNK